MIQYAIASYKRAQTCSQRTVATLKRLGVKDEQMTIFVADTGEEAEYRSVIAGIKIVVGQPGLIHQRRFYNGYYPAGEPIVNADDDIYDLKFLAKTGKLKSFEGDLNEVAEYAFSISKSCGAKLWGISAVENGFYMSRSTSAGLRYICGILHGSFAGDSTMCGEDRPLVSSGEDFETTLRSFRKYGSVVRLDWLCPRTKYFAPGGMQEELGGKDSRKAEHERQLKSIASRHAGLCSVYEKNGGVTNIRLKTLKSVKYKVPDDMLPE